MANALKSYTNTVVPPHQSKASIEELLTRVGAEGFRWSTMNGVETIEALISWKNKHIGFRLAVAYSDERERKQRLRAMYWYLKAKIEAIQFGIVDMEQEFLPYLLTAKGNTVYEELERAEIKGWLLEAPKDGAR